MVYPLVEMINTSVQLWNADHFFPIRVHACFIIAIAYLFSCFFPQINNFRSHLLGRMESCNTPTVCHYQLYNTKDHQPLNQGYGSNSLQLLMNAQESSLASCYVHEDIENPSAGMSCQSQCTTGDQCSPSRADPAGSAFQGECLWKDQYFLFAFANE